MKLFAAAVLLLAACGGAPNNDCACTIQSGDASVYLSCGGVACVAGYAFGCSEDEVVEISSCTPDLSVAPDLPITNYHCIRSQQACAGTSVCCADVDGGPRPTCDETSNVCCIPTGEACGGSADCCPGKQCVILGGQQVCGS